MKIYILSRLHSEMDEFEILDNYNVFSSLESAKECVDVELESYFLDDDYKLKWEKSVKTWSSSLEGECAWQIKELEV